VAIDRTKTLRQAEKLLRQGQLAAAIDEYERVLGEYPNDWNTLNALGDCYYRAQQAEKAVDVFVRVGDHLVQDGMLAPAGALYRKVLKIKPDHEHALLRAAEVATSEGGIAEARQLLFTLADTLQARGDVAGASAALVRIGALDPSDLDARLTAARKAFAAGAGAEIVQDMRALAESLFGAGRADAAIEVLEGAVAAAPSDPATRTRLARAWVERGDLDRARALATSPIELVLLAEACAARGDASGELTMLLEGKRLAPGDVSVAVRLLRACTARGDYEAARAHLDTLGDVYDPELFGIAGEIRARTGDPDRAREIFARLLAREPHRTALLLEQGLAHTDPALALVHVEAAADAQLARADTHAALAAYARFLETFPDHIPALRRLVDMCVDAGLNEEIVGAQTRLADACLAAGLASEARVIAEDLLARAPSDAQHEERLRRALQALGEPDVDAVIAGARGGGASFESVTFDLGEPTRSSEPAGRGAGAGQPSSSNDGAAEAVSGTDAAPAPEVFQGFHDDMRRQSFAAAAEQHYRMALAYEEVGMPAQAIEQLRVAVRSPRRRFEAAALLGRLSLANGRTREAIDWFERAAEAPAPSIDACRRLLYELADALEGAGEQARALAVFRELQAESGTYRDVERRIGRLLGAGSGSGG